MVALRSAGRLGGGLLAGLLVLSIFARVDRARLASLETFSETTAVGDSVCYVLPNPLPATPAAVARVGGQSLVPIDYTRHRERDVRMRAIASDSATRLTIYEKREEKPDADNYFVKLATNEYLRLRRAAP